MKMSTCTHQSMTNNHVPGFWRQLGETLHVWLGRYQARRELTHWSERDLHDVGLSWNDIVREVRKPFWRA
jgi:uncharacterized protein YjiS (DUF1127 family)